ncbi:MAG TPA: GspH/FimT family protein [Lysobacter sp.]|nr:GspH/FimT family protein [Lysobacter sp.]
MKRTSHGLTLLELLTAVAVLATVAAVALPAWSRTTAAAHAASARSALARAVLDSVRHAGLRGTEVVLCPSAEGATCLDSNDWSHGWIAFADGDGDRAPDPHEARLLHEAAMHADVHVQSTTGRRRVVFQPGGGNAGSNVTFTVCDRRGASHATTLVLANSGQMRQGVANPRQAASCLAGL